MDRLTIWEVFLFSVPEAAVIISIAFGLAGVKFQPKKILYMSVLTGIILYFIRPLVSSYIVNVILYIGVLMILFLVFKVMDFFKGMMSVILAVSIYLIIEYLNVTAIQFLFDIDPVILLKDYVLRFVCFLPQLLTAILISFAIRKYKLYLFTE
ncbi:MAG: Uncharacterized protein XD65_0598 [Caldanaerobacter subterraneus]|jgi:hypothetical protein|uniref:Uncharacterized protein n=2 Tax=Thermoanaerobacter TaxID=1754 RepID=B0KBS8_THEP3|nr:MULTISPECIES: hypothetical protein [Thermoanaerobacter]KUJ90293.1 MAG: hypothetical protein XD37_1469 [Thermoanaerobacter thermocopriae]KUK35068.1 MAG: Uncharacterized protein XD65_0598 [Caldanaerobacter subterraneus]ABY91807.1 hypothetical protein Teth514_0497 [Thermoanaerobacter sp. X514]ABY95373.1 hypothetical protein Teth39_1736 [Thermoanaerobacter pseudethanolicus ATCC 33223]ADV80317.1 hypothetical protein Thebr_1780 [Thermoanaerobacter brockii subsp. finnii Ako-1]